MKKNGRYVSAHGRNVEAWFWSGMLADFESAPIWLKLTAKIKGGVLIAESKNRVSTFHKRTWVLYDKDGLGIFPCSTYAFNIAYRRVKNEAENTNSERPDADNEISSLAGIMQKVSG